jgi:hypothetical protein
LDLSVGFYSENLHELRNITFHNLREKDLNCCHSGDIRHRQGACAEYVDIDVQKCLAFGIRYALVQVYNYDGRPMHEVKDTVFGLMERENAVANEIFVPKTISDCMGLANEGTAVLVCILDLKEHNYIWADIEADRCMATLENNRNKAQDTLQSLLHGTRMSVYDLLKMHAEARGRLVPSASEAKVSMQWENFVTSYAKVAEYMTF